MVCFVFCTLHALADSDLASAVGVSVALLCTGFLVGLLIQALFRCMPGGASACALEAFHVIALVFSLSISCDGGGAVGCFLLLRARESSWFSLPVRRSRCSVFCVLLGADVGVVLLKKLSAFRVLLLWFSGRESPSMGHVSSRAVGAVVCAAP
ncbi:hypothetical protein Taro_006057 [Colocasia esculenta]|uniref:Uncharacterized protein n=1 Tax=Colocasia esculenta TaxID=4460 RepID=A0A843TZK6_COLES|nr:hypothetical protein [Colocasia esculenta]